MEGRIGNHGNQKESSKEKETLTKAIAKDKGDAKASPKFFSDILQFTASDAAAASSGIRFSVFGQSPR